MKISSVSMVSPVNRYNNVNFQSKKTQENSNDSYISKASHKLAIPLAATVLAMSPVSSHAINNERNDIIDDVEMYEPDVNQQDDDDDATIIEMYKLPKNLDEYSNFVILCDRDGDMNTVEEVRLRKYVSNMVYDEIIMDHFTMYHVFDKYNKKVGTDYFLWGDTRTRMINADGTGRSFSLGRGRYITEGVYKWLKNAFGEAFPTREERKIQR